ncbi:MAG: ribulokinase, partial [Rikenellaceae bacterium]|nr:ribulokinase [Rikenellaceae bacterium]
MPRSYVIGIDFGTDSVRCLVVDACNGREVVSASEAYPRWGAKFFCDPSRNSYRQHPADYLESMEKAVVR